tara:strand:+ start:5567 stop:5722 length:156 start_codon:yes stop_codon:yes gene_type:complete
MAKWTKEQVLVLLLPRMGIEEDKTDVSTVSVVEAKAKHYNLIPEEDEVTEG